MLMLMAELQRSPDRSIHLIGLVLVAGRAIHACGVAREPEHPGVRIIGMGLTVAARVSAAMVNLGACVLEWTSRSGKPVS